MVDPISDEERDAFARKVKAGFVALVALSGGLMALQAAAGPVGFLAASGVGAVCGVVLLKIAFPSRVDAGSDATDSSGITSGELGTDKHAGSDTPESAETPSDETVNRTRTGSSGSDGRDW